MQKRHALLSLTLSTLLAACGSNSASEQAMPSTEIAQRAPSPSNGAHHKRADATKVESKVAENRAPSKTPAPPPVADSVTSAIGTLGGAAMKGSADMSAKVAAEEVAARGQKRRARKRPMAPREKAANKPLARLIARADKDVANDEKRLQNEGRFVHAGINPMIETSKDALSTFAVDVDTGSYTLSRRMMQSGSAPHASAVRVEEWVNYFNYDYAAPKDDAFQVHLDAAPSPLDPRRHIVRIGVKGKEVSAKERKAINVTFLVDVSGSMRSQLPLVKRSMLQLVSALDSRDSVGIVTYAGRTGIALKNTRTTSKNRSTIEDAINRLQSSGGTHMDSGMKLAYREAGKYLASNSVSRVVVLSDGDANIGRTHHQDILKSIKGYVSEGVTMSTIGFGRGNYRDHLMEQLANAGNGNYSYIDTEKAAKRVFVDKLVGTMQVIAKDVKIQVEFDKDRVDSYRLVGYENRDIADKDFRNDKVDAGEIGAGHSVTALYEVELKGGDAIDGRIATVRVRHKAPRGQRAQERAFTLKGSEINQGFKGLEQDARFAMAVSTAAEIFRGSPHTKNVNLDEVIAWALESAVGEHADERMEFVNLLRKTKRSVARR